MEQGFSHGLVGEFSRRPCLLQGDTMARQRRGLVCAERCFGSGVLGREFWYADAKTYICPPNRMFASGVPPPLGVLLQSITISFRHLLDLATSRPVC